MGSRIFYAAVFWFTGVTFLAAEAELRLHPLFTDHMVLQEGKNTSVWGTASPGDGVRVALGRVEASTTAGTDGTWRVKLPALRAGSGPQALSVESGGNEILLQDVLVGEVWVCSGQSNMQWSVEQSMNPEEEIAAATHPTLRLYYVPRKTADTPQQEVDARWTECTPETARGFSAVAYYFGRALQEMGRGPVGLIHSSWGGTPSESWTEYDALEALPEAAPILKRWDTILEGYPEASAAHEQALAAWKTASDAAAASDAPAPPRPRDPIGPHHPHRPASLYNSMIHPLLPYAIEGAIWYQGESNAGRAYQYRTLFPAMIESWRDVWNQGDFPFLFVQLANFEARQKTPYNSDWAELREAQLMTLNLKNTGMAVTIDIGDPKDIHPANKQEVGRRLALAAQKVAHGKKKLATSSPLFKKAVFRSGEAVLLFSDTHGGLEAKGGGPLQGFAIAGEDRNFVEAHAVIKGKRVLASSPQVPRPVAVRYGWADNPACNLYNRAGLPASPFRTDDWPGLTIDER